MRIPFLVTSFAASFCIGILFAMVLPAWFLVIVQAVLIIALSCSCCTKRRR